MKDIIIGFLLLFTSYSCIQFWYWFIHLEKTKQIFLIDNIFGGKNRNKLINYFRKERKKCSR